MGQWFLRTIVGIYEYFSVSKENDLFLWASRLEIAADTRLSSTHGFLVIGFESKKPISIKHSIFRTTYSAHRFFSVLQ